LGLLDGQGASILNSVFASIYPTGTLVRRAITEDAGGSQTVTTSNVAIKVQTDAVTEVMRQAAGYTDTDVRVIILSPGFPIPDISDRLWVNAIFSTKDYGAFRTPRPYHRNVSFG